MHHSTQPFANNGYGFVHSLHQFVPYSFDGCPHALLHRQSLDLKPAFPVGATTVGKSKEVKRLWLALAPSLAIWRGISTKLDLPRLLHIQGQTKSSQPLLQRFKEAPSRLFILESNHTVICVWPPERTCMNLAGLKMLTDWPGFEKLFREIGA